MNESCAIRPADGMTALSFTCHPVLARLLLKWEHFAVTPKTRSALGHSERNTLLLPAFHIRTFPHMVHSLSALGIAHTAVSLIPFTAGFYSFVRFRAIEPKTRSGRIYVAALVLSVITAFGLSSTGGFNAGHALGILTLLTLAGALLVPRWSWFGRARPYFATFGFSFSFFLLMVPGISESLRRLPVAHPLADSPESPIVKTALLIWVLAFVMGYALQVLLLRARGTATRP
jgi:hypothetical protein